MSITVNNKVSSSYNASIFYLILLFIAVGSGWFATRYLGDKARQEILQFNESTILTHSSHFTDEFEHIEREARVLSGSPFIAPALISRKDEDIANANSALDRYNSGMDSSVSYLMDNNGMTVASSNRNDPDSFVGKSYQFRPYFIQARNGAPGRYFALGVTSMKRGFYASYPVRDSEDQIIGVVVIKKDIDEKEADLRRYPYLFLVDPNGIIFLSSSKEMAFKSLWPISRETRLALLKSGQFGEREFDAVLPREVVNGMEIKIDGRDYLASRKVINPEGWSTVIMTSTERILQYKLAGLVISMWICTLIVIPMIINYRTSRSAEMVRASETRYRELFDNISSGVAIYEVKDGGKNFILKDFNKAGERIDGARKEDIIGKSIHEVRPGIKEFGLLNVFERVWRTGIPEHHPASFYHDQKISVWFENFVYKLPTGEMVDVYDDITDRIRAEGALRESQQMLQSVMDTIPVRVFWKDLASNYLGCNRSFALDAGLQSPKEIIGRNDFEMGWAEQADLYRSDDCLVMETGIAKLGYEEPQTTPSGDRIWLRTSKVPLFDVKGETKGVLGTYEDITDRKRAEKALLETTETLQAIIQASPVAIVAFDPDGNVKLWNPAAERLFGWREAEVFGQFLPYISDDKREEHNKLRERVLQGEAFTGVEVCRRKRDGSPVDISVSTAPMSDAEGNITGIMSVNIDITERKLAEAEKKKLEAQLFQAQKMESVGRLAGGVAHDFNNMLGVIIGRAELALNTDVSAHQLRHHLEEILNAGLRSADLTRRLLGFARKQTAVPKILDLNDTISGMLKMLRRLIGEDIDLLWEPGLDLWKVKIDPSQIDQILANLAVNARDAISGVGHITVRTENVVIDDSIRAEKPEFVPGDYVLLTVSDTGTGMSKEVSDNVFEPFFTTKEVGKGTGLGLSTVYGIVKQNEGFIYLSSEPGKGATFKIYLPRFGAEIAQARSEEAADKRPTGTETILLVEDDEAILNLGKTVLENLGYKVLAAKTTVHAIHLVEEHTGDLHLLITDVVMPEMNGRELAEQLSAIRPNIKCLYMSGYTADVIAHRGIVDEGVNFIQKPFRSDDLAARVRQVLDHLDT